MPATPSPRSSAPLNLAIETGPQKRDALLGAVALFTSFGTLFCCALPAALVTVGAGAVMAGLVAAVPQIVLLSEYKSAIFAVAGVMLLIAGAAHRTARRAPCPADPALAASCMRLRRVSSVLLVSAGVVYAVGFFFAFVAVHFI